MKKGFAVTYLVCIHIVVVVVLLKSDFLDRVERKLGTFQTATRPEITEHYRTMLRYQIRMDGSVPEKAVIFIGDSITQGLSVSAVSPLSVNYGIGGDTTFGVLQRLPLYKSIGRASAVVLAIGINDIKRRSNDDIIRNYKKIIEQIPKRTPVVLSAVLPVDEKSRDEWHGRNQARTKELNLSLKKLAIAEDRVFFVDATPRIIDGSGNLAVEYHEGDGIHLNSRGYAIWIDVLRGGLKKARQSAVLYGS